MSRKPLSIRHVLLLVVGMLTLLVTLLAGYNVVTEWQRLQKIQSRKETSILGDRLFDATEKFSIERDVAYSMLYAVDPAITRSLRQRLHESRQVSDEAFTVILHSITPQTFPELVQLKAEAESRLTRIHVLRTQIDQTDMPPKTRKALAERWYGEATALTQQTEDLWIQFVRHFTDIHPVITQHMRFKHFLRIITDYTGRQRSIIGRLLVENADPTVQESVALLRGQGVVDLAWRFSNLLAQQSGLFPAITASYTDAKSHYLTINDMMQDIFYIPGARHGASYPIDVNLWFELSDQAAESLDVLKEATFKETQSYIVKLETQAQQAIMLHLVLLLGAVALCVFNFRLITRRVIHPINTMVDALVGAMEGKAVTPIASASYQDEIGKLAQVLHAFQQKVEETRRATAQVKASENRLRAVVDNALNGIISINRQGLIETFNPRCELIFGYKAEEVIGKNIKMLMPEPYHSEHDGYLRHYLDTGDAKIIGTAGREVRARRKDGSIFPMDLSVSSFELEDGQHFSGIIRDITDRKLAEQALKDYMSALERSNKELDDFAYIASHDLKEPLRGIHNHSRFLLEDNQEKLDDESTKKLNRLVYLSQRMERLVNDLLYFSRLGRQDLAVQPTDINEVIHDIRNTLDTFLIERKARIHTPTPLPTITCDKPRITELFRNLITNAVKYNDKPKKAVEIGFLETHASPEGVLHRHVFYVKDDGKGIAPEFHEEIFRIFKRLQSSIDAAEEGTGVGLTFVKKIVERHGGKIWLESKPGQGTVFYFTLEGVPYDTSNAA